MKFLKDKKLAASVAFTHMHAKIKQTIIATAGVAFGITVFIFMVSFITGSNDYMKNVTFEQSPHLRLYNEAKIAEKTTIDKVYPTSINIVHHLKPKEILLNLKDGKKAVQEIKKDPRVAAVSGSVVNQVFFRFGSSSINGKVNGIEVEDEDKLFNLAKKTVEGSFKDLEVVPNSMVMGVSLAKKLNARKGDRLTVTTEEGENFSVLVVGIFKTGLSNIDQQESYASLATVQRFLNVPASYITDIKMKLYDMEEAPEMSLALQKRYNYLGSDWKKDNAALLDGEVLRNLIVYGVATTILLVAGFGIFNILTMMIYEKMKDIAILKAMGFSDTDVRWIFLTQALVIGLIGAITGLLFGFILSYAISKVPYQSDVMITLDHLPVSFNPMYYIAGFSFGILTTIFSGLIPSRKAAGVDPISILRG
ncbi:MAG TPA: ABC transporter permease [Pseudosphingobacterium sp.]|nr:ABC transporter permease [Pseudosphingobacterium sp.]